MPHSGIVPNELFFHGNTAIRCNKSYVSNLFHPLSYSYNVTKTKRIAPAGVAICHLGCADIRIRSADEDEGGLTMIKTRFTINVETGSIDEGVITPLTLAQVFKCAPARHTVIENDGLPASVEECDEHDDKKAALEAFDEGNYTVQNLTSEGDGCDSELKDAFVNGMGKILSRQAINTYRETFAMRKTFGIAREDRTNFDASNLPRIISEPVMELTKDALAELGKKQQTPKTLRQQIESVVDQFPHLLPLLTLRISILHRPMWDRDDPVARQNWKKIVLPQTVSRIRDLQRDLLRLDSPGSLSDEVRSLMRFSRLQLQFDRYLITVANKSVNRFGAVETVLRSFYDYLNDGVFEDESGRTPVRIDAPYIDYDRLAEEILASRAARKEAEQRASEEQIVSEAFDNEACGNKDQACAPDVENDTDDPSTDDFLSKASDNACTGDAGKQDCADDACDMDGARKADEVDDAEESDDIEEPVSHTNGVGAMQLAEQTVAAVRAAEYTYALSEYEAAQAEAAGAQDGAVASSEAVSSVWGIIYSDGSIGYFDTASGEFCDKPESKPDTHAEKELTTGEDQAATLADLADSKPDDAHEVVPTNACVDGAIGDDVIDIVNGEQAEAYAQLGAQETCHA